jgi:hypothetical protein
MARMIDVRDITGRPHQRHSVDVGMPVRPGAMIEGRIAEKTTIVAAAMLVVGVVVAQRKWWHCR